MLFDVSFALGAFFAGMMMRESEFAHRAADESLPLRDAFSVLFFVSVGMLFDPRVLLDEPLRVLAVVAIIMLGKTLAAIGLVLALRYPLGSALTIGASLAQIGEFSFILAGLGVTLGLLPPAGQSLILAVALISIALNPLLFAAVDPLLAWARARSPLLRRLETRDDPLAALPSDVDPARLPRLVVLVGHGRVGSRIGERLQAENVPYVVAERDREIVEALRKRGVHAVAGNASDPAVLVQAHAARARLLVIAAIDTFDVRQMAETARALNPAIEVVVCSGSGEEAALLESENIGRAFVGEHELAQGMATHVIARWQAA